MDVDLVTDEAALYDLRSVWDRTWDDARGRWQDGWAQAWAAWEHVVRPAGGRPAVVVVRDRAGDDAVRLLWPLATTRRYGATTLAPLGPDATDDTTLLATPGPDLSDRLRAAFHVVVHDTGADTTHLPFVPAGGELERLAPELGPVPVARPDRTTLLDPPAGGDAGTADAASRRSAARRERRLRAHDVVVAQADPDEAARLVPQLLALKADWAARQGRSAPWLTRPGYAGYLSALLRTSDGPAGAVRDRGRTQLTVVRAAGVCVGAAVVGVGWRRTTGLLSAHDPAAHRLSPGRLAMEGSVRWAFDRDLGVDLGPGGEAYKEAFASARVVPLVSLQVVHTTRGRVLLSARRVVRAAMTARPAGPGTRGGRRAG